MMTFCVDIGWYRGPASPAAGRSTLWGAMTRQGYARRRTFQGMVVAAAATSLFACTPRPDSPERPGRHGAAGPSQPEGPYSTYLDARPAALISGQIVEWSELRPLLNEASGAAVLREVIVDRMLEAELARA